MAKTKKGSVKKKSPGTSNGKKPAGGGVPDELRELYAFMTDKGLQSLEFDRKDLHVRLVRRSVAPVPVPVPVAAPGVAPAPSAVAQGGGYGGPAGPAAAPALPPNTMAVKSPMMGVFYRAPSPSSPPFVKEGDKVQSGDVIGLIEAMKVFNDLKAEVSGKVVRVLLENGKPVKVGQEIAWIERA